MSETTPEYITPKNVDDDPRLDLQHNAMKASLFGKLHAASAAYEEVLSKNPKASVLDVPCGTGIWAVEIAKLYPETTAKGVDISEVKSKSTHPDNVKFFIHDVLKPYPTEDFPPESFDIIHARFIIPHIKQGATFIKSLKSLLKPNGLLLLAEANTVEWSKGGPGMATFSQISKSQGFPQECGRELVPLLQEVGGFENIESKEINSPIGKTGESEHDKEVGALFEENMRGVLQITDGIVANMPQQAEMWAGVGANLGRV